MSAIRISPALRDALLHPRCDRCGRFATTLYAYWGSDDAEGDGDALVCGSCRAKSLAARAQSEPT